MDHEMPSYPASPCRILSLDGGGAKGFYTLGVLRELESLLGSPLCNHFELIFGTSTGAIIAALLALGKEVEEIHNLYKAHVPTIMRGRNAKQRSAALTHLAGTVFGELTFTDVKTGVGIVATHWVEEKPMIFKASQAQAHGRRSSFVPGFGCTIADAVRASCSAYPFFERPVLTTTKGDHVELIDGGYCANNPTLYAIADALLALNKAPDDLRVVSVGVGNYPEPKRPLLHRLKRRVAVWTVLTAIFFVFHGNPMPVAAQASSQTVTSPIVAPAGTTFVFYDDTDETNSNILNYTGAQKAAVVYGNGNAGGASIQCNASTCITYTQAQFNQLVENAVGYYGTSAVILFDFENILIGDATSTQNAMLRLAAQKQYLAWTRALYPNALVATYDQDNLNSYISVRQQIYASGGGTSYDFFAPQEYQGSSSTAQDVASGILNAMSAAGAVNPNLPVIPFIGPYLSGGSASIWSTILSDLYACTVPTSSACQSLGASSSTTYAKIGGAILYDGVRPTGPQMTIATNPLESWVQTLYQYQPPALSQSSQYQVAAAGGSCVGSAGNGSITTGTCSAQSTAQAWTFARHTICNSVDGTKTYYAANSVQTNISNGCTPTTSTSETIFDTSAGFYSIGGSGGVWDVNGSGNLVLTSGSQTSFSQLWQPAWMGNGYYQIVNVGSQYATGGTGYYELCLQSAGSGQLTVAKCNQSLSQSFALSTISTATIGTTLSVVANPSPVAAGQNVTYTATLTPSNTSAGSPTGTIQFYSNGAAVNAPVTINNNTATMTVASSSAGGTFSITAIYSGDANYKTSTSPATTLTVTGGMATVNDSSSSITYSGTWSYSSGRSYGDYNDDVHYTNTNGASASYTFTGKGIAYITEKYSDEGNVAVYIDGALQTVVNTTNSTRLAQQAVYSKTWTSSGTHTIKIVKSSGTNMLLDAFTVSN